ncbi:MAG: hypothetical protein Q8R54_03615 [Methylobacter sp.]|nr:hypothetical protein [Methylobacter sp.]
MNIGGDLNIIDNSQNEHKLLIHCSTEELLQERPFRQENLRLETKRKFKCLIPHLGFAAVLFLVAAIWAQINGKSDLVAFVFGASSLIVSFVSVRAILESNAFELQEQVAIHEINMILKSRRIE